jgi:hypothetical protein
MYGWMNDNENNILIYLNEEYEEVKVTEVTENYINPYDNNGIYVGEVITYVRTEKNNTKTTINYLQRFFNSIKYPRNCFTNHLSSKE